MSVAFEDKQDLVVIGAGPAGLTAAYCALQDTPLMPCVVEASNDVGGIARTEVYKGYRFDIGGHRFFTKVPEVERLWKTVLGEDFLRRPRLSRIYYRGKYYSYPLKPFEALRNMGPYESARIMVSYLKWKLLPHTDEETFEQWVTNRFGGRLFWHFFKSYTEKVWGIPTNEIRADWAAQRIQNLSLRKALLNAVTGKNDTTSLIERFDYPRLGPGMMWEAFRHKVQQGGGEVRMNSPVTRIFHDADRITSVEVSPTDGRAPYRITGDQFISTMPITQLVRSMDPPAPPTIEAAAGQLRYRDFLIVILILDDPDPFPDNWIYIHSPDVRVGRIQNFRSWSPEMVPEANRSSIGMEYFCNSDEEIWATSNEELIAMAASELEQLGLSKRSKVVDGTVIRQPLAYPVYDGTYREALDQLRGWLAQFSNLQLVGRNGMHRYNNQDHSMLTAMLAVKNIAGEEHDLWHVNVDRSYHEDIESAPKLPRGKKAELVD
jgi:protoporphyrinogen oxidase